MYFHYIQTLYTNIQENFKSLSLSYQINTISRYYIRYFQELFINFCEIYNSIYNNIVYAITNPMSMILLMILYGLVFLVLHTFVQTISKLFSGEGDKKLDIANESNNQEYQNVFPALYVIYEEEGEDADWFECFPNLLVSTDAENSEDLDKKIWDSSNASISTNSGSSVEKYTKECVNNGLSSKESNSKSYCKPSIDVEEFFFNEKNKENCRNFDFKQEKINGLNLEKNNSDFFAKTEKKNAKSSAKNSENIVY